MDVFTIKDVMLDEELSFFYNPGHDDNEEKKEDISAWDPLWTFTCCCKAKNCQGIVDRYRPKNKVITM
jgi:SET domain-containing protein